MSTTRTIGNGLLAGCAGTIAIDVATYLDMTLRGRASSETPANMVAAVADDLHVEALESTNDDPAAANRRSGLGAIAGYATGLTAAVAHAMARRTGVRLPLPLEAVVLGLGAMTVSDGAMTALGVTDPGSWTGKEWATDVVPHLVYGLVGACTYRYLEGNT